jgi:hypothetical protein
MSQVVSGYPSFIHLFIHSFIQGQQRLQQPMVILLASAFNGAFVMSQVFKLDFLTRQTRRVLLMTGITDSGDPCSRSEGSPVESCCRLLCSLWPACSHSFPGYSWLLFCDMQQTFLSFITDGHDSVFALLLLRNPTCSRSNLLDAAAPHPNLYKCYTPTTNPTNVTLNFTVEACSNGNLLWLMEG